MSTKMIREEFYFTPRFPDRASLEKALHELLAADATRTQWIADCPRRAYYGLVRRIRERGDALPLKAGSAIHAGLDTFYVTGDQDLALAALQEKWGPEAGVSNPDRSFGHLHLGHVEVVLKNYFQFSKLRDMFRPIVAKKEDLNFEHVVGAVLRLTDDDKVVLGESKVVMEFEVKGESFLYAGIPDLPIEMGGAYYILDHKSTNAYLSEWWAAQFKFSNQLRGYCLMIQELTGLQISGALINAIYMGEKASSEKFKGDRFARYGPYIFQPGHLDETILNQFHWRKALDFYREQEYYPQHASKLCSNCPFDRLCNAAPAARESAIRLEYEPIDVEFLDI